jgi:hypothetical protein
MIEATVLLALTGFGFYVIDKYGIKINIFK